MNDVNERQNFGALLRSYRTRAGLTQEQLAERAGLSRRGIADLERGARRTPHEHTVERLGSALGLSQADRTALVDSVRRVGSTTARPATLYPAVPSRLRLIT